MSCIYLKRRTKKGQYYLYCSCNKKIINYSDCKECKEKKYKEYKSIKKINPKKETVSKKTYNEVFERCDGKCAICGTFKDLHLHHIDGRGKDKTDNPNNCIILCAYCHLEVVHKNNKYWRVKLKEMI